MPNADDCILVLLQCRDREWFGDERGEEDWAREAARRCMRQGFGVIRVRTENWKDVKRDHPDWFTPLFNQNFNKQQVICSINYARVLCPVLERVHAALRSCDSEEDNVERCKRDGLSIHVPPGTRRVSSDLYVVCEASSNIANTLSLIHI